jgi:hypothetical protein
VFPVNTMRMNEAPMPSRVGSQRPLMLDGPIVPPARGAIGLPINA